MAIAGYFDKLARARETLDRYDEAKSGKVRMIPGDEVQAHFATKSTAHRSRRSLTEYAFHPEARTGLDEIWDYIAEENPDAADRAIAHILAAVRALVPLPY